ncbi:DNA replication initiation control protein YabA [Mammaliicoccus sp. Dog046]|uniref:DNA replication initiation control protein YabA n=1 Tax=Mammaliicoccus sp. Dog046 TaxID=3034233 RepID=UPI002B25AA0B|nr:DNA replication initiation control protein YabA [Mammaliicoccus sp. Dog046]WQK85353.1 DNA replication initiation control protein YabA [Mammaliicoccus sp. Dog046]
MNRDELFETIMTLESEIKQINTHLEKLKNQAVELVEDNVALQMENESLKRVVESNDSTQEKKPNKKVRPLQSRDNFAMLYHEGFHICRGELFGKHRQGQDCLFCLEVLNRE